MTTYSNISKFCTAKAHGSSREVSLTWFVLLQWQHKIDIDGQMQHSGIQRREKVVVSFCRQWDGKLHSQSINSL